MNNKVYSAINKSKIKTMKLEMLLLCYILILISLVDGKEPTNRPNNSK